MAATAMRRPAAVWLGLVVTCAAARAEDAAHWPQFRGPNAAGVAADGPKFPAPFGPEKNLLWKTALPGGVSSPCVWGEHIFLTAFEPKTKRLETLCLRARDGAVVWRHPAPATRLEKAHRVSSPAAATPATDGKRVVSYFGSFGLLAYDLAGKELWQQPLPNPESRYGSPSSPVLAGGRVLLWCEAKEPFLLALDPDTGKQVWKQDRPRVGPGYAVPLVRHEGPATEVIVFGRIGLAAYDVRDGRERWWVGAIMAQAIPTPVPGDGLIYVAAQLPGGDPDNRLKLPPFDELLKKYDKDKDGQLSADEIPADVVIYSRGGPDGSDDIRLKFVIGGADVNKDGKISRFEWLAATTMVGALNNSLVAVRPGGKGDVTRTNVAWRARLSLPEVPSPLYYRGRLYLVKNNGLFTCCDPKTGKVLYTERLGAGGHYYASPVAGDGKVYVASRDGVVTVVAAGDKMKVLARNDLGETIIATPALAGGTVYVRTQNTLYAFGQK